MYSPLPSCHHTRIVEIAQACNETLVLRLTVLDIGDGEGLAPEDLAHSRQTYDALSYTWGAPVLGQQHEAAYDASHDVDISIIVGEVEHETKIGRNLYEALLQIRTSANDRPLWIDAICINQSDNKERESHILLMCDIYTKATRVIVWTGCDIFNDFKHIIWLHKTVLDAIEAHIEQNGPLPSNDFRPVKDRAIAIYSMNDFLLPDESLLALHHFYKRRYFSRAWTLQEVALSTECFILLNATLVDFESFSVLPQYLQDLSGWSRRYGEDNAVSKSLVAMGTAARQLHYWHSSPGPDILRTFFGSSNESSSNLALLEFFLSQGAKREATDPRDLIYCLLGMVKYVYSEDMISPDYSSTVDAVFGAFTTLLLLNLPYRTVFSLVTDKPVHSEYVKRLPSWVPDFASGAEHIMSLQVTMSQQSDFMVKLSASLCGPSSLYIKHKALYLHAYRCGSVNHTFDVAWAPSRPGFEVLQDAEMLLSLLQACSKLLSMGLTALIEPLLRAMSFDALPADIEDFYRLWRRLLAVSSVQPALIHPHDPQTIATTQKLGILFDELTGLPFIPSMSELHIAAKIWLSSTEPADSSLPQNEFMIRKLDYFQLIHEYCPEHPWDESKYAFLRQSLLRDCCDRGVLDSYLAELSELGRHASRTVKLRIAGKDRFFSTDKQNVGRTTSTIRADDELWLICQAKVPYILRPAGDQYQLLGEAYVHGAMYGGLIEDGIAEAAREITII